MPAQSLHTAIQRLYATSPLLHLAADKALNPETAGLCLFDAPITGFASADDPLFAHFSSPAVIGPHYKSAKDWLPKALSVVSLFFPISKVVRAANRVDAAWPAPEWLNSRIEGQAFINEFSRNLEAHIQEQGYEAIAPSVNAHFSVGATPHSPNAPRNAFTSNWSERHTAFACGLGTFGLSKGLITTKGMAGRFTSLITSMPLPPSPRAYTEPYEWCTLCGLCVKNCPAGAISLEQGKDHALCSAFLDRVMEAHKPRYGCGKCQVGVACEQQRPKAKS